MLITDTFMLCEEVRGLELKVFLQKAGVSDDTELIMWPLWYRQYDNLLLIWKYCLLDNQL